MQYTHDKTVNFVIIIHTYRFFNPSLHAADFFGNEQIFRFCLKNNIYEICYSFFQIRLKFPYFGGIIVL